MVSTVNNGRHLKIITYFSVGKLSDQSLKRLATTIAGIMATYTRYPKKEEYTRVAREVIQKYPFLKCPMSGDVSSKQCNF